MILLLALGAWLVWERDGLDKLKRPGAEIARFTIGSAKGGLESLKEPDGNVTYRVLYRDGTIVPPTGVISRRQVEELFGVKPVAEMTASSNWLFRRLNITSWTGVLWVSIGFLGQGAFASRWLVQWVASEKSKSSVMPASFWWMSLFSGVVLFAYFVWRADIVGVLGQTSGVVVYARNIRLISKQARRAQKAAAASATVSELKPESASSAANSGG
jgi:lipid-A-disaccharide synthase-like uncharacterized protein